MIFAVSGFLFFLFSFFVTATTSKARFFARLFFIIMGVWHTVRFAQWTMGVGV